MKDNYRQWHPHKLSMVLDRPVSSLQLSDHVINALDNAKIYTIKDLLQLTKDKLLIIPQLSDASVDTILHKLQLLGF